MRPSDSHRPQPLTARPRCSPRLAGPRAGGGEAAGAGGGPEPAHRRGLHGHAPGGRLRPLHRGARAALARADATARRRRRDGQR